MPLLHPLPDVQRRYIPAARYLRGLKVGSYGSVVARSGMWSTQLVDGFDPDKSAVAFAALISECIEGNSLTYGGAIGDCIRRVYIPKPGKQERRPLIGICAAQGRKFIAETVALLVRSMDADSARAGAFYCRTVPVSSLAIGRPGTDSDRSKRTSGEGMRSSH